jgi:carbamoyl-phosphate synthase large subunit
MPRRDDIHTILILGSGPIVIGQGCEFDYSGTQACKALTEEGYRIVLVNSNPATIMTDPAFSDRTYIEPITPEAAEKIITREAERGTPIDALLPTLGGQTALNCACQLFDRGVLEAHHIEMIGASRDVIYRAEDRDEFRRIVGATGLRLPRARSVTSLEEARAFLDEIGLPAIIRPAFTLGGIGGGIAYNRDEFDDIVRRGIDASMIGQIQIDQSVLGWKEYELEVIRDRSDNCIIVCGIENVDAMGVHTGDSITVAPILTLTDKEYQRMRDAAITILRAVGVETGGSNVQFGVNPTTGEMVVIEMNPRVSRSSALASKATGFPIAKIAAKLAVGYSLDELRNDITGTTSACFEPSIDYVVTKFPRWTFEKFPEANETLTTQMKSVGEAMSIGRTFKESFQKAIRSMEVKRFGFGLDKNDKWLRGKRHEGTEARRHEGDAGPRGHIAPGEHTGGEDARRREPSESDEGIRSPLRQGEGLGEGGSDSDDRSALTPGPSPAGRGESNDWPIPEEKLIRKLSVPSQGRIYYIRYAMKMGWTLERIHELTRIDSWFLDQMLQLVEFEDVLCSYDRLEEVPREVLFEAKRLGYSDPQLANLYLGDISTGTVLRVREHRKALGIEPVYKLVDTCAAEFEAATPYFYSTYEMPYQLTERDEETKRQRDGVEEASAPTHFVSPSLRDSVSNCTDDEIRITDRPKIIILGGGPNRIGQGIEFDYCCCQAAYACTEMGFESVMINSNPETVSTDYDTSDLLFFEPLTLEDVLNVVERLNGRGGRRDEETERRRGRVEEVSDPTHFISSSLRDSVSSSVIGALVQFGGQTPLNLAHGLVAAGVPLIGTSLDSIDLAEDRDRFKAMLDELGLKQPESGIAHSLDEAVAIAGRIGYPVLVRPSYVLGGRGMETCFDESSLRRYVRTAVDVSELADAPVLIDRFLSEAVEIDVDVVADYGGARDEETERRRDGVEGAPAPKHFVSPSLRDSVSASTAVICGVMEHIERAGVHSGDSICVLPPFALPRSIVDRVRTDARRLAERLRVRGLMNVQMAAKDGELYVLEVNPRASRTVPFVAKATGVPWARLAAKVMMGTALAELDVDEVADPGHFAVKAPAFPFERFPGVDVILSPEMRSTGEVMGVHRSMPVALAKALMGAGVRLPVEGSVFLSVRDSDKPHSIAIARALVSMGFRVLTSASTHELLKSYSVDTVLLRKISEGARPNILDKIANGEIQLILNTPTRIGAHTDEGRIRAMAVRAGVPMITTITGARAAVEAIAALRAGAWSVAALQDAFPHLARAGADSGSLAVPV